MAVDTALCPACGAGPGTLAIAARMVANPLGSFSLAGVGMKVTARQRPVLTCSACALEVVGEYDGERHAVFTPPPGARRGSIVGGVLGRHGGVGPSRDLHNATRVFGRCSSRWRR